MGESIKTYKGFNKDMTCRGFQYEEGKEYEEESVEVCDHGFHACEYPLDCLNYYSPNESVYHEVEQSGKIQKHNEGTKVASTKIKIGAEISIAGIVKAAIEYTAKRVNKEAESDENHGASSATGDYGASSATGYKGASSATGLLLGATNQKQRAFLGHFLFLQTGNTLVQKIIRNMTEITRAHGFLTAQRWCRWMVKISSRILGIRLKMERLRRYRNEKKDCKCFYNCSADVKPCRMRYCFLGERHK